MSANKLKEILKDDLFLNHGRCVEWIKDAFTISAGLIGAGKQLPAQRNQLQHIAEVFVEQGRAGAVLNVENIGIIIQVGIIDALEEERAANTYTNTQLAVITLLPVTIIGILELMGMSLIPSVIGGLLASGLSYLFYTNSDPMTRVAGTIFLMSFAKPLAIHICNSIFSEDTEASKSSIGIYKFVDGKKDTLLVREGDKDSTASIGKTYILEAPIRETNGCKYIIQSFNLDDKDKIDLSLLGRVTANDLDVYNLLMNNTFSKGIHVRYVEPELLVCLYDYDRVLTSEYFIFAQQRDEL